MQALLSNSLCLSLRTVAKVHIIYLAVQVEGIKMNAKYCLDFI